MSVYFVSPKLVPLFPWVAKAPVSFGVRVWSDPVVEGTDQTKTTRKNPKSETLKSIKNQNQKPKPLFLKIRTWIFSDFDFWSIFSVFIFRDFLRRPFGSTGVKWSATALARTQLSRFLRFQFCRFMPHVRRPASASRPWQWNSNSNNIQNSNWWKLTLPFVSFCRK